MAKQFAYRDAEGFIYPGHAGLAFQPGLVPGQYDTETRVFTPTGNPQQQTGSIITDAKFGQGDTTVLSGLSEDKGADTAPIGSGVAWTQPAEDPDAQARVVELEQQLADEQQRNASLSAQIETLSAELSARTTTPAADTQPEGNTGDAGSDAPTGGDGGAGDGSGTDTSDGDAPPATDGSDAAQTDPTADALQVKRVTRKSST